ncbi:MAG TPA: ribulose-phosphate 3-epimerase [bacterium]|nr:ribulose-phosphate 3-epimerase [bacterium]
MKKIKIAPSMLSSDFSRLGEEVKKITEAGADMIHFDVMDGHFVPNITFGPMVIKSVRQYSSLVFDTHLMISEPQKYWKEFADAGSDIIGIHIETAVDHKAVIKDIQDYGKKACMVVNPPTAVESIYPFLEQVEQVLVMSVNPGFGGQKFMHEVVHKIEKLAEIRSKKNLGFEIQIDGGINEETAGIAKKAGTEILVAGSFVFKSKDYRTAMESLR